MIKIIENTLVIRVEERTPVLAAGSLPVSGSRGCDSCMFIVSEDDWGGLEKSAVFWQTADKRYEVPLGKGDTCRIPDEALSEDGQLFIGLLGKKGNVLQNTKALLVPLCEGAREGNSKVGEAV